MRTAKLITITVALITTLAIATASANATSNGVMARPATAGGLSAQKVSTPKLYEYCESGQCWAGDYVALVASTKEWYFEGYRGYAGGHYAKSGKLWTFKYEGEFNHGCEFRMKKSRSSYSGEAQGNCYAAFVSEEFKYDAR